MLVREAPTMPEPVCVQAKKRGTGEMAVVALRDTADPDGAVLVMSRDRWRAFVAAIKNGYFDDL